MFWSDGTYCNRNNKSYIVGDKMEDFRQVIDYVIALLSIEIPLFGYRFSIISIVLGMSILSIVIGIIVKIFGGKD